MKLTFWVILVCSIAGGCRHVDVVSNVGEHRSDKSASRQESQVINSLGMTLYLIHSGTFNMGTPVTERGRPSDDSERQRRVTVKHDFFIGIHLVTRGQFGTFVTATNYVTDVERGDGNGTGSHDLHVTGNTVSWRNPGFSQADDHPAVMISWNDARAFCQWLARREGRSYRLPSEVEWEYACRAGTSSAYFWGNDRSACSAFANVADASWTKKYGRSDSIRWNDGFVYTSPVGSFKPNPWGLFDMTGNVEEWCLDQYGDYDHIPTDEVKSGGGGRTAERVLRGGSWSDDIQNCRSGARMSGRPEVGNVFRGFRVVCDAMLGK